MADVYIGDTIQKIRDLHRDILHMEKSATSITKFISLQAQRLMEAHASGNTAVVFHLACWCKPYISKPKEEIMNASVTLEQARQSIAAEYGFSAWSHIENLADTSFDIEFEACIDNMLHGELSYLQNALKDNPQFATQKSQYGHQATLLHYLSANGVESYRQITPLNAADIAQTLINAGADVNAEANIYGGSKALGLLVTSAHPANAGVVPAVKAVLESANAKQN